jgi:hypothetical protein
MKRNSERTKEFAGLLGRWDKHLEPEFLRLGLDLQEFWAKWTNGRADMESVREMRLLREKLMESLVKWSLNARPESLESLAEDD